ncbi:MAG: peroxidase-related enzyme, partial [Pseudomonadota bacterium]
GEAVAHNYRYADLDARQQAVVDFALKLTRASAEIEEADRDALRSHGLTDEDIWDLAAVAAFFNMSNRMASAVAMQPNPDYHAQGR